MPYTPPSHRSPASSVSASPDVSRRSSIQHVGAPRPSLPHSSSYLNKHRRTPSVTSVTSITNGLPEDSKSTPTALSSSVRQSPPPRTEEGAMPNGAIISPPESASSGSDDDGPQVRGRKSDKLKDLRNAVSQISHSQTPPPATNSRPAEDSARSSGPNGMRISFSTTALDDYPNGGRKNGHIRSATEPKAVFGMSNENSLTVSEEDSDDDLSNKPPMVRKKSGELVRPALRPSSRRRPSSMPGTPNFSKAVHFDSHLEHVRHFLQVDRPLAVSAGSSPVEAYDSDNEYPFPGSKQSGSTRTPPFEWEMLTPNFPHDGAVRKSLPVRLEKVWLSPDQKSMLGSVAVANLAFNKYVTCRFTLDYWKTTSEVVAEYSHEVRPQETPIGHDRFTFSIKLSDMANLESKTLFFCVRYSVNGQEFWDNNAATNFQVDFRKKHLPQNGKNNFQGASSRPVHGLPRSNHRRQSPVSALRPVSMPASFDEFGNEVKFNFDQPIHEYLGESGTTGLRLKTRSATNLASDNIAKSVTSPSGVAFANRYDFGASLTAAVQAAKDSMGRDKDTLYMKSNVRDPQPVPHLPERDSPVVNSTQSPAGSDSPNVTLPSASYEELVNKYCFFGSKQSSPTLKDGTLKNVGFDGASGGREQSTESLRAVDGNSQTPQQHAGPATHHHAALTYGTDSYFAPATNAAPVGASSLRNYTIISPGDNSTTPKAGASVRSLSPAFPSIAGAASSEIAYSQQPMLSDRFPFGGEAHAAPAIRG